METMIKAHHLLQPSDERAMQRIPSFSGAADMQLCSVTNENWRGKNNPLERRRIQNRLNQRAFRQRQRAGEAPKHQRSISRTSSELDDEEDVSPPIKRPPSEERRSPVRSRKLSCHDVSPQQPIWDELAQLINGNFMAAAYANAQKLGVDMERLRTATPTVTLRPRTPIIAALQPVELQYQLPHDPIIDIIPHPTLRFNILKAIATHTLDPGVFSTNLRTSGMKFLHQGQRMRGGLVVWSVPEQIGSWELSEHFMTVWAFLLEGCEDLISATNMWRNQRGERSLFPGFRTA